MMLSVKTPDGHLVVLKYVRPNTQKRELGHTNFVYKGEVVGYMLPDRSDFKVVGKEWHFVKKCDWTNHFSASNRDKIIDHITKLIDNYEKTKTKRNR